MQIEKLFHVLVVGGALIGGQSIAVAATKPASACQVKAVSLHTLEGELEPIFCTTDEACPKDASGHRKVKDGFECCWGTSCETLPQTGV